MAARVNKIRHDDETRAKIRRAQLLRRLDADPLIVAAIAPKLDECQEVIESRGLRFYVYRLFSDDGKTLYVGKGSGDRLKNQIRNHNADGEILQRFKLERDAYKRERELIAELAPLRNRHPGGNGSRAARTTRKPNWFIEIERVGTSAYAARLLLKFDYRIDAAKRLALEAIASEPLRTAA